MNYFNYDKFCLIRIVERLNSQIRMGVFDELSPEAKDELIKSIEEIRTASKKINAINDYLSKEISIVAFDKLLRTAKDVHKA